MTDTSNLKPVLITCPTTNQEIPTGSWTTQEDFEADKSTRSMWLQCPACNEFHEWSRSEAFLGTP